MLKLKQKKTILEGKKIAYVEAVLCIEKYTYNVHFDKDTKKRFNAYCKTLGFKVGQLDDETYEKLFEAEVEVNG